MADDKIIQFPKNRIVNDRTRELDAQRKKMGEKVAKQIQQQQTKQFVETAVDDISMNLLKSFVDLAMKTNNPNFTKDLALLSLSTIYFCYLFTFIHDSCKDDSFEKRKVNIFVTYIM